MLASLIPLSVFASSEVTAIDLTLAKPKAGEAPSFNAALPDGTGTEVISVKWSPSDDVFIEGKTYTVTIDVGIKAGFDGVFAKSDKIAATMNGYKIHRVKNNGANVTVKFGWNISADKPVTAPTAPSVTNTAVKAVSTKSGFSDVADSAYYANAVKWAVDKKITSGTSATTFSPDDTCTRAQILTFLWRAVGSPKSNSPVPFGDVNSEDYFADASSWAKGKDMVSGSNFEPDTPCTRAFTVIYLWKNAGSPKTEISDKFSDVNANSDYAQAVAWAVNNGVTSGTSATTFSPVDTCTRGQIVTFLNRALSVFDVTKDDNTIKTPENNNQENNNQENKTDVPVINPTETDKTTETGKTDEKTDTSKNDKNTKTDETTKDNTTKNDNTKTDNSSLEEVKKNTQNKAKYDTAKYETAVKKALREALGDNLGSDMTQLQKALLLHDWLLLNCQYDETVSKEYVHSEYGAIVNGLAVCSGYARAYNDLLSRVGIEAEYVCGYVGKASMETAHAWSFVTIDGIKYHVDVTFDDPVPDVKGRTMHTYFLVSDAKLKDHIGYNLHCTVTKYDDNQILHKYHAPLIWDERINKFYYIDGTAVKTTFDLSEPITSSSAKDGVNPTSAIMTDDGKFLCFAKPNNSTSEYPMYLYCIETGEYYNYTVKGVKNIIFDRLVQNGSNIEPSRDYYKNGMHYMTKADASIPIPKSIQKRSVVFDPNYSGGKTASLDYLNDYWKNGGGSFDELTRKGYTFCGWYTAKDGGEKIESLDDINGSSVTLYAHWWGSWTITKEPTVTETGKAVRELDGYPSIKEEVTIPELSDSSVWKKTQSISATTSREGFERYTSEYGDVRIIIPKLEEKFEYGIKYKDGSVYITVIDENTYNVGFEAKENGEVVSTGNMKVITNGAGEYRVIYPKSFTPSGTVTATLCGKDMNSICSTEYEAK